MVTPVYVAVDESIEDIESYQRESVISRGATETIVVKEKEYPISKEEIELIALVTMAEAEGECEQGKRLVIDTILNRKDSNDFPNTIKGVIYQPHQFTSMWNGRVDRCEVREDICDLVKEELESRTNSKVIFFNARHYSQYGVPMLQVEHHYFSSSK
jgi:N-acetylmuramoyl-L-alanine amidase